MTASTACRAVHEASGLACARPTGHKRNHEAPLTGLRGSWIEWGDVVSLVAAKNGGT